MCIRDSLRASGALAPVRSPRVLWQMRHVGDPPRPLTWRQLRAGGALQGVVLASRRRPAGGGAHFKVASWNVRWL
eukprot:12013234-Alexandrium_andersonii.AAC.1